MRWPFVSRSRYEAELATIRSYNDALRERCERAEKNEATERVGRRTITRQHAELDAANRRLEGRLVELGRRLTELAESDPDYAAKLERRVARLRLVSKRILAAYKAERQRADRLSSHLDDADLKAIKTWEKRTDQHDAWKPPTDREQRPIDGASSWPTHPAVELRRALERCRALEMRLSAAEGRKRVAS